VGETSPLLTDSDESEDTQAKELLSDLIVTPKSVLHVADKVCDNFYLFELLIGW